MRISEGLATIKSYSLPRAFYLCSTERTKPILLALIKGTFHQFKVYMGASCMTLRLNDVSSGGFRSRYFLFFFLRKDNSHAAPFKMNKIGFRAIKTPPIQNAFGLRAFKSPYIICNSVWIAATFFLLKRIQKILRWKEGLALLVVLSLASLSNRSRFDQLKELR